MICDSDLIVSSSSLIVFQPLTFCSPQASNAKLILTLASHPTALSPGVFAITHFTFTAFLGG
jgi:hypothetical protein